jgi:ABC-2 type transport system ATP-binding protein
MKPLLEFDRISRRLGVREVLRDFSLTVPAGEVFALLGRNGAGKTTALELLLGFREPDAGRCAVLGTESSALTPRLRDRIAFVPDGHPLFPTATIAQLLDFEAGTRLGFDRARVEDFLGRARLDPHQRVDQVSRGQRGQLALMLATANRPEVLVLDDPGAGLDPAMRRALLGSLVEVLDGGTSTVLFTSHQLDDVERLADRVGFLHGGRLVLELRLAERAQRLGLRRAARRPRDLPAWPGLLSVRAVEGAVELISLDEPEDFAAGLEPHCGPLTPRVVPTLEELFVALTDDGEGTRR